MAKDTKDGNNLNEKSYVNKKLLQCYLIISMVLLVAYIMELVKGNRTAGYVFVFSIILIVPVIMAAFADTATYSISLMAVAFNCVDYKVNVIRHINFKIIIIHT